MSITHHEHNQYQRRRFAASIGIFKEPVPGEIQERTSFIVASAKLNSSDRVLDVGTGTGALLADICRWQVHEIVGCDLCPAMLEEAARHFPDVHFWCGDVVNLPAEMGSFDVAFLNAMFGNVWDQRKTLRFLADRLRQGGRIVISHPMGASFVSLLHASDPLMVPHELPCRNEIANLIANAPLQLSRFQNDEDLYLCVLVRE